MNKQKFFKITFFVIVIANFILAIRNYLRGDIIGFLISALVVILWAIVAFGMTRFVVNE